MDPPPVVITPDTALAPKSGRIQNKYKGRKPIIKKIKSTFDTQEEYITWLQAPSTRRANFTHQQETWLWEYVGPSITGVKIDWDVCSQEYYKVFKEKRTGNTLNLRWYYVDRKRKSRAEKEIGAGDPSTASIESTQVEGGDRVLESLGEPEGDSVGPYIPAAVSQSCGNGGSAPSWLSGTAEEVLQRALGGTWGQGVLPVDTSALQTIAPPALGGSGVCERPNWNFIDDVQLDPRLFGGAQNLQPAGPESLTPHASTYTWVPECQQVRQNLGPDARLPSINEVSFQYEYSQLSAMNNQVQDSEHPCETGATPPVRKDLLHVYTSSAAHMMNLEDRSQDRIYFGPLGTRKPCAPTTKRYQLNEILDALRFTPLHRETAIYSDSSYAINCVTVWCIQWERYGWVEKNGKPVENRNIIQGIVALVERRSEVGSRTVFEWVEGVNGD